MAAMAAPTRPATPCWTLVAITAPEEREVEDALDALKEELVTKYLSRSERTKTQTSHREAGPYPTSGHSRKVL
jgi:hypothetical protein